MAFREDKSTDPFAPAFNFEDFYIPPLPTLVLKFNTLDSARVPGGGDLALNVRPWVGDPKNRKRFVLRFLFLFPTPVLTTLCGVILFVLSLPILYAGYIGPMSEMAFWPPFFWFFDRMLHNPALGVVSLAFLALCPLFTLHYGRWMLAGPLIPLARRDKLEFSLRALVGLTTLLAVPAAIALFFLARPLFLHIPIAFVTDQTLRLSISLILPAPFALRLYVRPIILYRWRQISTAGFVWSIIWRTLAALSIICAAAFPIHFFLQDISPSTLSLIKDVLGPAIMPLLFLYFTTMSALLHYGREVFATYWDALISWFTYGAERYSYESLPLGIWESPAGTMMTRYYVTCGALFLLGFLVVPPIDIYLFSAYAQGAGEIWNRTAPPPSGAIPYIAWTLAYYLLGPLAFCGSTFLACAWPLVSLRARVHGAARPVPEGERSAPDEPSEWSVQLERLACSTHPAASTHLYLGTHAVLDIPMLLPRDVLTDHAHIIGSSGSGKTSLGLLPLVLQLIRFGDSPVIIIDLKGDKALFNSVRREAGERFKWFTNIYGRSTHIFNPLYSLYTPDMSVNQVAELILDSLGLEHGLEYGRSYYSRVTRDFFIDKVLTPNEDIADFAAMERLTAQAVAGEDAKLRQDVYELLAVIRTLAKVAALNIPDGDGATHPAAEHAIHMPEVVEKNQVIYFFLDASLETAGVREVGLLATRQLLTAMRRHSDRSAESKRGYLIIDEFQRMAAQAFDKLLEQARSSGLSLILSHQSMAQLRSGSSTDLSDVVQENTRFKQVFAIRNPDEAHFLSRASGETLYRTQSWSRQFDPTGQVAGIDSTTVNSFVGHRLTQNDIIRFMNDPQASIDTLNPTAGLWQWGGFPQPVRHLHTTSLPEYEKLNSFNRGYPWPEPTEATIVPRRTPPKKPKRPRPGEREEEPHDGPAEPSDYMRAAEDALRGAEKGSGPTAEEMLKRAKPGQRREREGGA